MVLAPAVHKALRVGAPVVALESALLTHGLPFPTNLDVARQLESAVARAGSTAATIAMLEGVIYVGLSESQLDALAAGRANRKLGIRDLAGASVQSASGGTTVAGTMHVANLAGIQLFATGGIGGVHRENPQDVSADLAALASIPIIVVCAGAKAILDIPATLERLESASVPVIGFRTDEFPAFYSRTSGHEVSIRLEHPAEIAAYWSVHRSLGSRSAVLIANPIPESHEVQHSEMEAWISEASAEAVREGVHGQALTPFLLRRLAELSGGRSVEANKALLLNNALVASQIAAALVERGHLTEGIEPIR